MKTIAKIRGIKGYKSISEERLLSALNESKSVKDSRKNFDDARIRKMKKKLLNWEITFWAKDKRD